MSSLFIETAPGAVESSRAMDNAPDSIHQLLPRTEYEEEHIQTMRAGFEAQGYEVKTACTDTMWIVDARRAPAAAAVPAPPAQSEPVVLPILAEDEESILPASSVPPPLVRQNAIMTTIVEEGEDEKMIDGSTTPPAAKSDLQKCEGCAMTVKRRGLRTHLRSAKHRSLMSAIQWAEDSHLPDEKALSETPPPSQSSPLPSKQEYTSQRYLPLLIQNIHSGAAMFGSGVTAGDLRLLVQEDHSEAAIEALIQARKGWFDTWNEIMAMVRDHELRMNQVDTQIIMQDVTPIKATAVAKRGKAPAATKKRARAVKKETAPTAVKAIPAAAAEGATAEKVEDEPEAKKEKVETPPAAAQETQ